eukprot:471529_1
MGQCCQCCQCFEDCCCAVFLEDDVIGTYNYDFQSCFSCKRGFVALNPWCFLNFSCCFGCGISSGNVNTRKYYQWRSAKTEFERTYIQKANTIANSVITSNCCFLNCLPTEQLKEAKKLLDEQWMTEVNKYLSQFDFYCDIKFWGEDSGEYVAIRIKKGKQKTDEVELLVQPTAKIKDAANIIGIYEYKGPNSFCCCCYVKFRNKTIVNSNVYPEWNKCKNEFENNYLHNADLVVNYGGERCCDCNTHMNAEAMLDAKWTSKANTFLSVYGFSCDVWWMGPVEEGDPSEYYIRIKTITI